MAERKDSDHFDDEALGDPRMAHKTGERPIIVDQLSPVFFDYYTIPYYSLKS